MRAALLFAAFLIGSPAAAAAQPPNMMFYCDKADPAAIAENVLASSEAADLAAADKAAGLAAVAQADSLRAQLGRGEPLEAPYDGAGRFGVMAHKASDPVLAELFRRVAMDQFARLHLSAALLRQSWATGLSPAATTYAYGVIESRDACGLDQSNTAWLEKQIDAQGWFKRSAYGADADNAAFLLVQHADLNRPFQKKVLAILTPLLASGDVRPQNYALLFDRVAVGEGRPQRYGSQGGCTGAGQWTEKPVEDAASLDKVRATVGLEPMAAYRARFVGVCGGVAPTAAAPATARQ